MKRERTFLDDMATVYEHLPSKKSPFENIIPHNGGIAVVSTPSPYQIEEYLNRKIKKKK